MGLKVLTQVARRTRQVRRQVPILRNLFPRQDLATERTFRKIRYTNSPVNYTTYNLSTNDFADIVVCAASAVAGFRLYAGVRLIKIEIWTPATSGIVGQATGISWNSNSVTPYDGSPGMTITDTPMGTNDPGHIVSHPPLNSAQASWISSGSAAAATVQMFSLTNVPQYALVEFTVEVIMATGAAGSGFSPAGTVLVAATPGIVYHRVLPVGVGPGNGLTPVGPISL